MAAVSPSTSLGVGALHTRCLWRQETGESARRSSHYPRMKAAGVPCAGGCDPGSCTMEAGAALGGRTGRGPGAGPEQTRAAEEEGWQRCACRRTPRPGRGISHSNRPSRCSCRRSARGTPLHVWEEGEAAEVEEERTRTCGLCRDRAPRRRNEADNDRLCRRMEADNTPPQEALLVVCF